ncbi:MAG: DUF3179 domain-containing protein [Flavobacteriaceae bacterium]
MYHKIPNAFKGMIAVFALFIMPSLSSQEITGTSDATKHFIILLTSENDELVDNSFSFISNNWNTSYESMLIETLYYSLNRDIAPRFLELLQRKTGEDFGFNIQHWQAWLWNKPPSFNADYFDFKATLHSLIDPKFGVYFSQREELNTIRLDEVIWGGVKQDGIPPLRNPKMVGVEQAAYLNDSDIVFGIKVNGDARAYPKRILAWHEMFIDSVGGIPVAGVYCTLCGTVIIFETNYKGINHQLGTSGFLYRSNKLMYDKETQSLWSTMEGEPVIGPLTGKGIRLNYRSVVTTSWGEWKERHPNTKVLSVDTGFLRDYSEGAAYRDYFATDELMFQVPEKDNRLKNKDEILAIRLPGITNKSLAIASKFLKGRPVYSSNLAGVPFTVFTDRSGAHRVYNTNGYNFKEYDGIQTVVDHKGERWELQENQLISNSGDKLTRIPTHNAFWFGYRAAFPDTELIK